VDEVAEVVITSNVTCQTTLKMWRRRAPLVVAMAKLRIVPKLLVSVLSKDDRCCAVGGAGALIAMDAATNRILPDVGTKVPVGNREGSG